MWKAMRIFLTRCKIFETYRDSSEMGWLLPASPAWPASVPALSLSWPSPALRSQDRSITVAIVFSNKQLQEAWAKFLSNLFPDNKYRHPIDSSLENKTIEIQIEKDLLFDSKVQRTRKAHLFWTRNKEKWQLTWNVEAALLQKVDQSPSVFSQLEIISADKVSSTSLCSKASGRYPDYKKTLVFFKMKSTVYLEF